ncbi:MULTISPECIES: hypothetical protein [unclassified Pseudoxanthomonas]|uniref:hypothetical protein n=1 Tax=unclassified Pseudoxanthomonas TaxID=2645906 RepID=UPI00307FB4AC
MRNYARAALTVVLLSVSLSSTSQTNTPNTVPSHNPAPAPAPARAIPATNQASNLSAASLSAEDSALEKAHPKAGTTSSSIPDRAALYQLLYENQKEANKDLNQLMQWSIALVATFLVGIAGSQIFFNYRLRKSDIEKIRKANDAQIKSEVDKALDKTTDLVRAIESNERSARDQLSKFVSGRIDTIDENLKSLKQDVEPLLKLPKQLSLLDVRLHDNEGQVWKLRGVESNALTRFIKAAELLLKADQPDRVKHRLSEIEKILSQSKDIYSRDLGRLEKLIEMLPDAYAERRDKIVELYKDLPVFDFLDDKDPDNTDWHYIKNAPAE